MAMVEPFFASVQKGDVSKVRSLIQRGVDVNMKDRLGWTALHYAAFVGNGKVIFLAARFCWKVNNYLCHNYRRWWSCFYCLELLSTHKIMTDILLYVSFNCFFLYYFEHTSALFFFAWFEKDWAVLNNHKRVTVMLTEKGANHTIRDNFGEAAVDLSPMHLKKVIQGNVFVSFPLC